MSSAALKSGFPTTGTLLMSGLVIAGCAAWYTVRKNRSKNEPELLLTEQQLFEILKEFRIKFFPMLQLTATMSQNIQRTIAQRYGRQIENIKEILTANILGEESEVTQKVEEIELGILARHNIDDPDAFKAFCLKMAKKSTRIAVLMNEIRTQFDSAVMGKLEYPSLSLAASIDIELVKDNFMEVTKTTAKNMLKYIHKAKTSGEQARPPTHREIMGDHKTESFAHRYPDELLQEYHVEAVYKSGLLYYKQNDMLFAKKMEEVLLKNDRLLSVCSSSGILDLEKLNQEIDQWTWEGAKAETQAAILDVEDGDWHTEHDDNSAEHSQMEDEDDHSDIDDELKMSQVPAEVQTEDRVNQDVHLAANKEADGGDKTASKVDPVSDNPPARGSLVNRNDSQNNDQTKQEQTSNPPAAPHEHNSLTDDTVTPPESTNPPKDSPTTTIHEE